MSVRGYVGMLVTDPIYNSEKDRFKDTNAQSPQKFTHM